MTDYVAEIKGLALIGMFASDVLFERFVLKGGNALDLVHRLSKRSSVDLDLSMEGELTHDELEQVEEALKRSLAETFAEQALMVIDFKFEEVPPSGDEDSMAFLGGLSSRVQSRHSGCLHEIRDVS